MAPRDPRLERRRGEPTGGDWSRRPDIEEDDALLSEEDRRQLAAIHRELDQTLGPVEKPEDRREAEDTERASPAEVVIPTPAPRPPPPEEVAETEPSARARPAPPEEDSPAPPVAPAHQDAPAPPPAPVSADIPGSLVEPTPVAPVGDDVLTRPVPPLRRDVPAPPERPAPLRESAPAPGEPSMVASNDVERTGVSSERRSRDAAPAGPVRSQAPKAPKPHVDYVTQRAALRSRAERRARSRNAGAWLPFSVFLVGCAVGAIVACLVTLLVLRQFGALVVSPGPTGSPAASPGPPRAGASMRPPDADGRASSAETRAETRGPSADRRALEQSLREWLDATRRRDVPAQMRFYPARVPVFYSWRDVPKERVREEKMKVTGRARVVDIETDAPEIVFQNDGREAIMQFRKRYTIAGPGVHRRGEVLQELRWTRDGDGWKIIGERDAAVLSSAPR
jgi:hypothetical protein